MTEKQANAIKRTIAAQDVALTPKDAAEIIGADPQALRDACRAGTQGFPVYISGDTIKIPARPFFAFWGIEYETATPNYEKRLTLAAAMIAAERKNNNA